MNIDKGKSLRIDLNDHGYLRPLHESDVTQFYVDGLNDPEVNRFLIGPRAQRQSMNTVKDFVRINRKSVNSILFGLYINGVLSGTARLHDATQDEVYLGLALFDKNAWGLGWGRQMIAAVSKYALQELGVKKITAGIEVDNVASQKAFHNSGFEHVESKDKLTEHGCIQVWECIRK